jgi:hypothetical protein
VTVVLSFIMAGCGFADDPPKLDLAAGDCKQIIPTYPGGRNGPGLEGRPVREYPRGRKFHYNPPFPAPSHIRYRRQGTLYIRYMPKVRALQASKPYSLRSKADVAGRCRHQSLIL